MTPIKD